MLRGNQHGGREYDDLQNWLDMTSHENPLYFQLIFRFSINNSVFEGLNNDTYVCYLSRIKQTYLPYSCSRVKQSAALTRRNYYFFMVLIPNSYFLF